MGLVSLSESYCWGYIDKINGHQKAGGLKPLLFYMLSTKHNYEALTIGDVNLRIRYADVFFHPYRFRQGFEMYIHMTTTFYEYREIILTTPGELYTSYEKLLLPFDSTTWLLIHITFLAAFIGIFIINKFPKFIQTLFYGENVQTPTLNVISTFFGLAQFKVPKRYLSRFLLILFVYFCLIFRTCYQSKLYEFMTTKPRRPPPKTVWDLKMQNYTVYTSLNESYFTNLIQNEKEMW